jgi:HD-GYP domain-containing protein (c-di-GMP phosphodiesterase class II)
MPRSQTHHDIEKRATQFRPHFVGMAVVVAGIVIAGVLLVSRFSAMDYERDKQSWNEKLNLVAESRARDVGEFVSGQMRELRTLSENPSLRLYMAELQNAEVQTDAAPHKPEAKADGRGELSQKSYLRNLLLFTAGRVGLLANTPTDAIPANVPTAARSGVALLNQKNELVVSTAVAPSVMDAIARHAQSAEAAKEGFIDMQQDGDGSLYIGFVLPVYMIQGEKNAESQIGKIVAIKAVDQRLFSLLDHPGITEKTMENMLVRRSASGDGLDLLSPLRDGTSPLSRMLLAGADANAVEPWLVSNMGAFSVDYQDYQGQRSVATSRSVPGTPWVLITKVNATEAFAESSVQRAGMITFLMLMIAGIAAIVIAVWWYTHARHSRLASEHFKRLAARAQAQERLLRLVADNQHEAIFILDNQQTYCFANKQAADDVKMKLENMLGKTVTEVRGAARAAQLSAQCNNALRVNESVFDVQRLQQPEGEQVIRSAYIPLAHIPLVELPENTSGVLVVEQDITEAIHEREQRLSTQRQLVHTLVKLVDRRDPFAANHSMLVAQVAYEVAMDMELDNVLIETARTAASLMNIGKVLVPSELLTKTDELSDEEKRTVRDAMNAAADMVKYVTFDGPVCDTLRQWQEKWDGTGPLGISGEDILMTARIIAVANAFVGMISPRSWRTAMPIEAANKFLLEQADSYFDRRVVIALMNYVENHSGRNWLKQIIDQQKAA